MDIKMSSINWISSLDIADLIRTLGYWDNRFLQNKMSSSKDSVYKTHSGGHVYKTHSGSLTTAISTQELTNAQKLLTIAYQISAKQKHY